jgi:hypothetical protein
MRTLVIFSLLFTVKAFSRLFYRHRLTWVQEPPEDRWEGYRVVVILNHTSLFEFLWAGSPPASFLWQIAKHGVIPVAEVTTRRPLVGKFFQLIAQNVVPVSRERDHTWQQLLASVGDPKSIVILAPEGRMMRSDGLDKAGRPMTVRGGIADILEAVPDGRFLVAYSAGLHHVQAPGERWPRVFRTIRLGLECIEIEPYRRELLARAGRRGFKRAVVDDLERRRDLYCFPDGKIPPRETRRTAEPKAAKAAPETAVETPAETA